MAVPPEARLVFPSLYGFAGGVSTSGDRGFGLAGAGPGAEPGAGLTSIGGGSGATCWLATGGFGAAGAANGGLGVGASFGLG